MKQEKKKTLKLFYAEVSKGQTLGQIDNPECDQYSLKSQGNTTSGFKQA